MWSSYVLKRMLTWYKLHDKMINVAKRGQTTWKEKSNYCRSNSKFWKKLLTVYWLSCILRKSLDGDKNKQEITAKVVRKKMVFENWTE